MDLMDYRLITPQYYENVFHHLRDNFFADEPLNKAARLCVRGQSHKHLEDHSLTTMKDNLSLMAIIDDSQIAGVILNGILRPGDIELAQQQLETNDDEKYKRIFHLLHLQNQKVDLFQRFQLDKVFDVRILSVDEQFRGRGIAKQLVLQSEALARQHGFKIMKADATGIFSQKILKTNGFEVLLEQYYNKYVNNDGQPILQVESPHIKLQLLYKLLN